MRIDLGRTEVGVSQEFLHDAQIGPVVEQMGREGMAQHVRMNGLVETGLHGVFVEQILDPPGRERLVGMVDEDELALQAIQQERSCLVDVFFQKLPGIRLERHDAFL